MYMCITSLFIGNKDFYEDNLLFEEVPEAKNEKGLVKKLDNFQYT